MFLGYSCALVSDILLQGHLYITENYFAFHSNVFGYVTRVSINTIRGGQFWASQKLNSREIFFSLSFLLLRNKSHQL